MRKPKGIEERSCFSFCNFDLPFLIFKKQRMTFSTTQGKVSRALWIHLSQSQFFLKLLHSLLLRQSFKFNHNFRAGTSLWLQC